MPTMRRRDGERTRAAGFSLVEAMVVVVILGLVIAAAIPNFANSNRRRRVESAATEISTRLQLARQRTVASRLPRRLVADLAAETYWIERSQNDSTWIRDPDEDYTLPQGVDWTFRAGAEAGNRDVEFESRGTILSEDAPVAITFTDAQGDSFMVSLVRTGRVTVRSSAP